MGTETTRQEEGAILGNTGTTGPPTGTTGLCTQQAVPPAPLPAPYRRTVSTLGIGRQNNVRATGTTD